MGACQKKYIKKIPENLLRHKVAAIQSVYHTNGEAKKPPSTPPPMSTLVQTVKRSDYNTCSTYLLQQEPLQ